MTKTSVADISPTAFRVRFDFVCSAGGSRTRRSRHSWPIAVGCRLERPAPRGSIRLVNTPFRDFVVARGFGNDVDFYSTLPPSYRSTNRGVCINEKSRRLSRAQPLPESRREVVREGCRRTHRARVRIIITTCAVCARKPTIRRARRDDVISVQRLCVFNNWKTNKRIIITKKKCTNKFPNIIAVSRRTEFSSRRMTDWYLFISSISFYGVGVLAFNDVFFVFFI